MVNTASTPSPAASSTRLDLQLFALLLVAALVGSIAILPYSLALTDPATLQLAAMIAHFSADVVLHFLLPLVAP